VILFGGLVTVAGVHPKWQPIQDDSPAPLLGTITVIFGMVIVVLGIVLAVANVIVWLGGRRRSD
jgi:heme/copper-type cytochrome/quinol oxidase subunit 2